MSIFNDILDNVTGKSQKRRKNTMRNSKIMNDEEMLQAIKEEKKKSNMRLLMALVVGIVICAILYFVL